MAHRDMDARKIMGLLTNPLDRSGYWAQKGLPNSWTGLKVQIQNVNTQELMPMIVHPWVLPFRDSQARL